MDAAGRALAYRDQFPILKRKTYLISASLGPLSIRSRDHLDRFTDLWASEGSPDVVWFEHLFPMYDRIRELLAGLIGASAREVALAPNISVALSSVASMFDYRERPRVIVSELDFPTDLHVWAAQARRGVEVVRVPSRDGVTVRTEDMVAAIDERTQLVEVNRVLYRSGALMDLAPIAARAHEVGAYVVVDDFHGTGVVPLDVWEAGTDFYLTGVLKWLLGGGGLAFLVVRDALIPQLESQVTGWWANTAASYFSPDRDLVGDARRFETGTTAAPVAPLALGGLEIVSEVGVETIRARHRELSQHAFERARDLGLTVASPADPDERGGLIRVLVPDSQRIFRELLARDIVVDERAGGIRVAPHFFNTLEELDLLFDALRTML